MAPVTKVRGETEARCALQKIRSTASRSPCVPKTKPAVFDSLLGLGPEGRTSTTAALTIPQTGPFGGEENSGMDHFGGEWIIEEFTTIHWIALQYTEREYPV
jgi:hypothetical protein